MPKDTNIKKVLVIGSGPIVIGQAAEFDYAGTQACRALKEEGIEVVLVNSNPATIMTDKDIADHVYIEPLNSHSLTQVIEKEQPDAVLPTLGGQTGLNLAMNLYEEGILGSSTASSCWAPPPTPSARQRTARGSRTPWSRIGQPCVASKVVHTVEDAVEFAELHRPIPSSSVPPTPWAAPAAASPMTSSCCGKSADRGLRAVPWSMKF